jgi:hypothetical protein
MDAEKYTPLPLPPHFEQLQRRRPKREGQIKAGRRAFRVKEPSPIHENAPFDDDLF